MLILQLGYYHCTPCNSRCLLPHWESGVNQVTLSPSLSMSSQPWEKVRKFVQALSPFTLQFNKKKYAWVQLAGHQGEPEKPKLSHCFHIPLTLRLRVTLCIQALVFLLGLFISWFMLFMVGCFRSLYFDACTPLVPISALAKNAIRIYKFLPFFMDTVPLMFCNSDRDRRNSCSATHYELIIAIIYSSEKLKIEPSYVHVCMCMYVLVCT